MIRGLRMASVVCQDTTSSVLALRPNCRCSPLTGGAPVRSGWYQTSGPRGCDQSSAAPATPTPAPATPAIVPVGSSVRRLMPVGARSSACAESSLIGASYRKRVNACRTNARSSGRRCFGAAVRNESGSVSDMTNVRILASAVAMTVAGMFGILAPVPAQADPAGHQVTYTITSTGNLTGNVRFINSDPASQAAFDANSAQYLNTVQTSFSAGEPLVYTTTLANPN